MLLVSKKRHVVNWWILQRRCCRTLDGLIACLHCCLITWILHLCLLSSNSLVLHGRWQSCKSMQRSWKKGHDIYQQIPLVLMVRQNPLISYPMKCVLLPNHIWLTPLLWSNGKLPQIMFLMSFIWIRSNIGHFVLSQTTCVQMLIVIDLEKHIWLMWLPKTVLAWTPPWELGHATHSNGLLAQVLIVLLAHTIPHVSRGSQWQGCVILPLLPLSLSCCPAITILPQSLLSVVMDPCFPSLVLIVVSALDPTLQAEAHSSGCGRLPCWLWALLCHSAISQWCLLFWGVWGG